MFHFQVVLLKRQHGSSPSLSSSPHPGECRPDGSYPGPCRGGQDARDSRGHNSFTEYSWPYRPDFYGREMNVHPVCACYVCSVTHPCPTLVTPQTIARQGPLSMEFSGQEYWSGLPFPSPGDLPDPGTKPESLLSPALAGRFFITSATSLNLVHSKCFSILPSLEDRWVLSTF